MQMHLRMLLHMDQDTFIADVEAALSSAGISAARLCRVADIAQSTWHRWKLEGVTPRGKTRGRVVDALHSLGAGDRLPKSAEDMGEAA
jgi:hypothetical protein